MISDLFQLTKIAKDSVDIVTKVNKGEMPEQELIKLNRSLSSGSMAKFLKRYVVEPTIFVTRSAQRQEAIDDIINRQLDIFVSFYVRLFRILCNNQNLDPEIAVSLMGTGGGVGDVAEIMINKGLQKVVNWRAGVEDFQSSLLSFESSDFLNHVISTEDQSMKEIKEYIRKAVEYVNAKAKFDAEKRKPKTERKTYTETTTPEVDIEVEKDNDTPGYEFYTRNIELTVGFNQTRAIIEGELTEDGNYVHPNKETWSRVGKANTNRITMKIPIIIKAAVIYMDTKELLLALEPKKRDTSFFRRFEELSSGRISTQDFIFGWDLIKARKEQRLKDVNNMIGQLEKNIASANAKTLAGPGMVGFEKYYNMFVITSEDEAKIRSLTSWDITTLIGKENFLTALNGFSCFLFDPVWNNVTLMIKDIDGVNTIQRDKIKTKNKKEDLTGLVAAILQGNAPRF